MGSSGSREHEQAFLATIQRVVGSMNIQLLSERLAGICCVELALSPAVVEKTLDALIESGYITSDIKRLLVEQWHQDFEDFQ